MSPVSPVFYTVVTVRIGLKTQLEWEHPFYNICKLSIIDQLENKIVACVVVKTLTQKASGYSLLLLLFRPPLVCSALS